MKVYVHLWWYLAEFFVELEILQTKIVEKNTFCIQKLFPENLAVYEIMSRNIQLDRPQTICYVHVLCMLDNWNAYCFSTATMVSRTLVNITLYLYCLSCFNITCKSYLPHLWYIGAVLAIPENSPLLLMFTYGITFTSKVILSIMTS
jgi:hypothetical protein